MEPQRVDVRRGFLDVAVGDGEGVVGSIVGDAVADGDGDGDGDCELIGEGDAEALGDGEGAVAPRALRAAAASTRPDETTAPIGVVDDSRALSISAVPAAGRAERSNPTTPDTTGVAADVPQKLA